MIKRSSAGERSRSSITSNLPLFVFLFLFLFSYAAYAAPLKATIDPSELAAGARPLGLGRAYAGWADDAYAIFQNPAGLTKITGWQVASMYTRLIEEVDYNLLGIVRPMDQETLGIGYVKAAVEGSLLSRRDPVTERIVPDSEGAIGYHSSVLFFSYAVKPVKYFPLPYMEDVSLGLNLKIFNQALTGIPTGDVTALGHDMDIGLQYRPYSFLSLGAVGYNILPYSMGGSLMWETSGISESIPASAKLGCSVKLIGEGGLREFIFYPQDLIFSYDYEFTISGIRPALVHFGLEWFPFEILALRLGVDQDAVASGAGSTGIDNNLSAGIGLNLFNFRFDYAFHTFGEISANASHFFSLTYGIERKKLPSYVPPEPTNYLEITEPAKKVVNFDQYVIIKGKVLEPKRVKEVKIGELSANMYVDNTFMAVVKLKAFGLNMIEVRAINGTGRIVDKKIVSVSRLIGFTDVGKYHPLRERLGALGVLGYVSGFRDGSFRPEGYITRAQLCKLLVSIKATREARVPRRVLFKDVSKKHWAAGYIAEALRMGIAKGYPDKRFRPGNGITRAQAVAMLVRFAKLKEPDYVYEKPFPDVKLRNWAVKPIFIARKQGLLDHFKGKKFEPKKKITRGEVVEILSKIDFVSKEIKELLE